MDMTSSGLGNLVTAPSVNLGQAENARSANIYFYCPAARTVLIRPSAAARHRPLPSKRITNFPRIFVRYWISPADPQDPGIISIPKLLRDYPRRLRDTDYRVTRSPRIANARRRELFGEDWCVAHSRFLLER